MHDSLRTLLNEIVDYAGLFPPAELPLDAAVRNFCAFREGAARWMLGRFVCPAARLNDLKPLADEFAGAPLRVSALGRAAAQAASFTSAIERDVRAVQQAAEALPGLLRVDAFEVRMPPDALAAGADAVERCVSDAVAVLRSWPAFAAAWFEPASVGPLAGSLMEAVRGVSAAMARAPRGFQIGLKLRCGGTSASAFPSEETIAGFLRECGARRVPQKFTAGLHHPLPRDDAGLGVRMHGFLNVFVAGALARVYEVDRPRLVEMLCCRDVSAFAFTDEFIGYQELAVPTEELAYLRRDAVASFGSCSFDEPRDDLHRLGLIDET